MAEPASGLAAEVAVGHLLAAAGLEPNRQELAAFAAGYSGARQLVALVRGISLTRLDDPDLIFDPGS